MNLRAHVSFALTESIWLISHSNRFPPGLALARPIRSVYLKRGGLFSVNTVVCLHFSSADCYLSLCFALTVCRVRPFDNAPSRTERFQTNKHLHINLAMSAPCPYF